MTREKRDPSATQKVIDYDPGNIAFRPQEMHASLVAVEECVQVEVILPIFGTQRVFKIDRRGSGGNVRESIGVNDDRIHIESVFRLPGMVSPLCPFEELSKCRLLRKASGISRKGLLKPHEIWLIGHDRFKYFMPSRIHPVAEGIAKTGNSDIVGACRDGLGTGSIRTAESMTGTQAARDHR